MISTRFRLNIFKMSTSTTYKHFFLKAFFLFSIIGFISSCASIKSKTATGPKKTDAEEMNLKKEVKSIKEAYYSAIVLANDVQKGQKVEQQLEREYSFDKKGNITEVNLFNTEEEYKVTPKFDKNGLKTSIKQYDKDGELIMTNEMEYDNQGNETEIMVFDGEGNVMKKETYDFDEQGNKTKSNKFVTAKKIDTVIKHTYNQKNLKTHSETLNAQGEVIVEKDFKYDDKGNEIERNKKDVSSKAEYKMTALYDYDSSGNWTQKIEFVNGKPQFLIERKLEYYND